MTLGEKIFNLRSHRKMSQGDLAEKLNVSRQSISKWETNQSIPELDKLIQLSDLFQISLDDLVRSDAMNQSEEDQATHLELPHDHQVVIQQAFSTQKIVGFILLAIGLLSCLMALVFGSGLLIIGGYIIFCGILCLLMKNYAGLVIGWITMILAIVLEPFLTGGRMLAVLHPGYFRNPSINLFISLLMWVFLAVLIIRTIMILHKQHK